MRLQKIFLLILSVSIFLFSSVEAKKYSAPILTAEFDQMDYAPLYLTFSWEALPRTEFYQVQVIKDGKIFRELFNVTALNRVTDWMPYKESGEYCWQVRVVNKKHKPLSDWSERKYFKVEGPVKYAAFGDSITHGGANYIPAGQLSCQWETYCDLPIKNLARSGDTTQMMLERFENDVLPFAPEVLIIMGGVNDIREGKSSTEVIKNLEVLREKCLANGITPIFCTITSMNPEIIKSKGIFITDGDWREARTKINDWIKQTPNFIDASERLNDEFGYLRADWTPDGLHPALRGKKIIGEAISNYLMENLICGDCSKSAP